MNYLKLHLGWLAIIVVAALGSYISIHSWLQEHDARLIADAKVAAEEKSISDLRSQIASIQAAANQQIASLKKQRAAVTTPAQAVSAIPDVSNLPLRAAPVLGDPTRVTVDVLPLFQELNQCKQDAIALNACQATAVINEKVIEAKDAQIVALKKKPGFWKRVTSHGKDIVGIGVPLGVLVARLLGI